MSVFLVALLGFGCIEAYHLGDPTGLHFDVHSEYATSYEDYKPRDYKFEYGVSDPHTGDHKSQWEVRENGVVRGEYSLLEPDGTTRIVQYIADHHGFRATVKKIGHAIHPIPVHHHTPETYSSPIIPEVSHIPEPYYKSYDGAAENYINVLDDPHLLPGGIISHHDIPHGISYEIPQEIPHEIPHEISHEIPHEVILPQSHNLESVEPTLTLSDQSSIVFDNYHSIDLPKVEVVDTKQTLSPLLDNLHLQQPLTINEHVEYADTILPTYGSGNLGSYKYSSLKEEPVWLGMRVEHPHGESSSSYVGTTGNLNGDDYSSSGYAKEVPSIGWDSLGSELKNILNLNPYQYLSKRSIKKDIKKSP